MDKSKTYIILHLDECQILVLQTQYKIPKLGELQISESFRYYDAWGLLCRHAVVVLAKCNQVFQL